MKVKNNIEERLWQLRMMEYLSYSLTFFIPLYFINNHLVFSFNAPKTIFIIGIVLIILILFLWRVLITEKLSFRFTPIHIILSIFLGVLTLSSILGIDPLNSFFGKWTEGVHLVLIYAVVIFASLIGFLVKKNKDFLPKIIFYSFISGIFVSFISYTGSSIFSFFNDNSSTLGNTSYTGSYLLFSACFGIGLFFYYFKIWQKILIAMGTIFIIFSPVFFNRDILLGKVGISSILSQPFLILGTANAAAAGLAVSFIVILSLYLIFSSKKIIKIIGLIIFLSLFVGILYTGFQLVKPTSSLHAVYTEKKGENRFISWDIAQKSFADKPLLGSGFNNFSYNYQKYFTPEILKEKYPELYLRRAHNIFWEYLTNTGILGLLSFLLMLFFTFFALFRRDENEKKGIFSIRIILMGTLLGYFVQNLFGFDTPTTYMMIFILIGIAIGLSHKEWIIIIPNKNNNLIKFFGSLSILTCLIGSVLFVFLPLKEFKQWGKVVSTNNIKERISLREGVQEISLFGGVTDSSYVADKFYELYKESSNGINDSNRILSLKEIQSTINRVEKDKEKQPNDIRTYLILNRLINLQISIEEEIDKKKWNESYDYIIKAKELSLQNPEPYILLAQTYALKQDFKNAFIAVRKAIEIAPTYTKSYEYTKKLLEINPDKDFEKYIDEMEKKFIK